MSEPVSHLINNPLYAADAPSLPLVIRLKTMAWSSSIARRESRRVLTKKQGVSSCLCFIIFHHPCPFRQNGGRRALHSDRRNAIAFTVHLVTTERLVYQINGKLRRSREYRITILCKFASAIEITTSLLLLVKQFNC